MRLVKLFTVLMAFSALYGFPVRRAGAVDPQAFVGDYANIANLTYVSDDCDHGAPTSLGLAICQMQDYLQFGVDVPRSPHYLRWQAAAQDSRDDIYPYHGISSPLLLISLTSTIGAPSLEVCPRTRAGRFTSAMHSEAAVTRRVNGYGYLSDVPDYPAALAHLAANPGDAIQLATDGWDGYAIIGVDDQGRGIWLRFYDGRNFNFSVRPATVDTPTTQQGIDRWERMVNGNSLPPINYMAVWRMQEGK